MNTGDTVDSLKEKIKQRFAVNDTRDLELWKTEIHNDREDEFLNLVLDENHNMRKLIGKELNEYWGGEKDLPLENHTHIIIDSPYLILKLENQEEIERLRNLVERLEIQNREEPVNEEPVSEVLIEYLIENENAVNENLFDEGAVDEDINNHPNINTRTQRKKNENILSYLFLTKKVHEGDEVKYGDDHIGFLTTIEGKPCITYNEKPRYSIGDLLKAFLGLDKNDNPKSNQRRPFSIRGIRYDELRHL